MGRMTEMEEIRVELAGRMAAEVDSLAWTAMKVGAHAFPDWTGEPPILEYAFNTTRDAFLAEIELLGSGTQLPTELPEINAETARQLARGAIAASVLIESYRNGHQVLWNRWEELVDDEALPNGLAREVRRAGSDFFFDYAARYCALAVAEHEAERVRTLRSSDRVIVEAVCAVLDGDRAAARRLDHPVDLHNVAILGSGDGLRAWLEGASRELDCLLLVVDVLPDATWAWFGRSRPFTDGDSGRFAHLQPPSGCRIGTGNEQVGAAGFRLTHQQAAAAFVATDSDRALVEYGEIAIEDLASSRPDAAERFLRGELGSLDDGEERSQRLMATLTAYFDCGDNARATAKRLGIHHQTVAQRLEGVEERLGASIRERRTELALALRLRDYLKRRSRAGVIYHHHSAVRTHASETERTLGAK